MSRVKISDKYQIVIPKDVRKALNIRKGQIVSVVPVEGVIEVVPDQNIDEMEGIFPTLTLEDIRDESERGCL
ncbi:MAG: AbrB/MazE/SpoVT family DNA-binding domain-containing protein [Armatimonadota bacterium]